MLIPKKAENSETLNQQKKKVRKAPDKALLKSENAETLADELLEEIMEALAQPKKIENAETLEGEFLEEKVMEVLAGGPLG